MNVEHFFKETLPHPRLRWGLGNVAVSRNRVLSIYIMLVFVWSVFMLNVIGCKLFLGPANSLPYFLLIMVHVVSTTCSKSFANLSSECGIIPFELLG